MGEIRIFKECLWVWFGLLFIVEFIFVVGVVGYVNDWNYEQFQFFGFYGLIIEEVRFLKENGRQVKLTKFIVVLRVRFIFGSSLRLFLFYLEGQMVNF